MDSYSQGDQYDAEYFLRGRETGKSLYEDYRWLPNLTIPMAEAISDHCGIRMPDSILDFGCARGYLVKALSCLGHTACGVDISKWALENADPAVRHLVSNRWPPKGPIDWIIAKDVLEHLSPDTLGPRLSQFSNLATTGVFIVVPLAGPTHERYVVPEYEKDPTHQIRWTLGRWVSELIHWFGEEWEIAARYRIAGIKDNYAKFAYGNGFITCRKI